MLAIVCDGMGGMEGGEIASRMCAELVYNGYYQMGKVDDVCQVLKELVTAADDEVSAITDQSGRKLRSGTTACGSRPRQQGILGLHGRQPHLLPAQRGGSRITRDHNFRLLLQEQCNAGYITQEDVETDGQKEALISYVGKGGNLLIDTGVIEFGSAEDDMILLLLPTACTKALPEEDIQRLMLQHAGNSNASARCSRARGNGGRQTGQA